MLDSPFFSVLLVTYNSSWDATRRTLYSILCQKDIDFEIVIADDGSKENNFSKIKEYFATNSFKNYTLVENKQNQGTVKNVLSGLEHCKGKYVKPISPSDYLYDQVILKTAAEEIKKTDASIFFGRCVYYSITNGNIIFYKDKMNPLDVQPYLKQNYKQILKKLFLNGDFILGASTVYKTSVFKKYLTVVSENGVQFAEDMTILYMIANGEIIEYLNNINAFCWYEYGIGISTNGNSIWKERLNKDRKILLSLLYQKKLIKKWIYKLHISMNWIERQILKLLYSPDLFFNNLINKRKIKGYEQLKINSEVLKNLIHEKL